MIQGTGFRALSRIFDRGFIGGGSVGFIMQASTLHIKVRYSQAQGRYLTYFLVSEPSGRSYGSHVIATSHDVQQAMKVASEEGARRRIPVIPYVW